MAKNNKNNVKSQLPDFVVLDDNATAELRIIGNISNWENSSEEITERIDSLIEAGVVNLNCYINSTGGSMFEAPEIANQLKRFTGMKTAQLGAMCCSAATIISLAFDKVIASPNTIYMIHNPTVCIDGDVDELLSAVQLLGVIKDQAIVDYCKKTKQTADVITQLMDATTWMSAGKALAFGFVDEIAGSEFTDEQDSELELNDDANMAIGKVSASGIWTKNQLVPINSLINSDMNKPLIIAELSKGGISVQNNASDSEVVMAISQLVASKNEIEQKYNELNMSVKKQRAKLIVENAIQLKKIAEAEREEYMKDATENPEMVEKMLSKIPNVPQASTSIVPQDKGTSEDRSKWSFDDYFKKDPQALAKMKADNLDKYKELYEKHYGIKC